MKMIKYLLIFSLLFCPLFGKTKNKPKYYISISAIFRNEARFLKEWIEYHRMVGIEHFYLFNHLSEDDCEAVLEPYVKAGIVELFYVDEEVTNGDEWHEVQNGTYNKILSERKHESFWLALIDTDEFLVPVVDKDIPSFLKKYEQYRGVCVHWQLYGTSGIARIPEGKTMIGTLLHKAKPNFQGNRHIKSIVQPSYVIKCSNAHFCDYKKPYFQVDETGTRFTGPVMPYIRINMIRLNHYVCRDEEFFYTEKARRYDKYNRPRNTPPPTEFSLYEDLIMLRYVPELERRLFGDFDD